MLFAPIVLAGLAAAAAIPAPKQVVTVTQVVDCTVTLEVHSTVGGDVRTVTRTGTVEVKDVPSLAPAAKVPQPEDIVAQAGDAVEDDEDEEEDDDNAVDDTLSPEDVPVVAENKAQVVEERDDVANPNPEVPVPSVPENVSQQAEDVSVKEKTAPADKQPKIPTPETGDVEGTEEEEKEEKKEGKKEGGYGGGNGNLPKESGLQSVHSGDGTVFDFAAGGSPLACEVSGDSKAEKWFAVSHLYPEWANKQSMCGKEFIVTYKGKSCKGKLYDKCMGCKLGDIDLSFAMWNELTDEAYPDRFQMTWTPVE